jgi:erythromycin esterase
MGGKRLNNGWLRRTPAILACVCVGILGVSQPATSVSPQQAVGPEQQQIVEWIRKSAIPLRHIEAGLGFADLQPLPHTFDNVTVVGLGETTHGTREFFQVKHRLLEFLVTQLGFTVFALESSFAACQPINDYVLFGKGDLPSLLTAQGYVGWDTQEMVALLEWMRGYNHTVPDERKVKFYGLDFMWNVVGRREVSDYLRRVAPDQARVAAPLFETLDAQDAKKPQEDDAVLQSSLPGLTALAQWMDNHKSQLVEAASLQAFVEARQYLVLMERSITWKDDNSVRSRFMSENLAYILEHERPGTKAVVWAHNTHISKTPEGRSPGGTSPGPYMGYHLKQRLDGRYYAMGLEFYRGAYQTRVFPENGPAADLKEGVLPPAPAGSAPSYLAHAGVGT